MNPPSSENYDAPIMPEAHGSAACKAAHDSLQRRLDGELFMEADEIVLHRGACADCRAFEAAVALLKAGLKKTAWPVPPANLVERIMARQRAEPVRIRRRTLRRLAFGFTLAASVLIAIFAVENRMQPEPQRVTIVTRPLPTPPAVDELTPLGTSIDEAGEAVATLTRKTADETIPFRLPTWTLPRFGDSVDALERLEPAVASIQEIQHGAIFSVAPITNSARRAVDMLWREIGPDPDRKQAID